MEPRLDWDDLRYFLSVARNRTLAGAAKELRVTQSTVGRRIASFEKTLGARLLNRHADGYVLTLAGGAILAQAMKVESEALALQRTIRRHEAHVSGSVRVMSSQLIAAHLLASSIAKFHARTTDITIELLPTAASGTSAAKNVDITVQLRPFEQEDLVVRKLASVAFALYASETYLAQFGLPSVDDGCSGHRLITSLDDKEICARSDWLLDIGHRGEVVLRTDSYETQIRVAASGGGLAVLPCFLADSEVGLRRIETGPAISDADIWLGVHDAHRGVPRIRMVIDCMADAIRSRAAALSRSAPHEKLALMSEDPKVRLPQILMA